MPTTNLCGSGGMLLNSSCLHNRLSSTRLSYGVSGTCIEPQLIYSQFFIHVRYTTEHQTTKRFLRMDLKINEMLLERSKISSGDHYGIELLVC